LHNSAAVFASISQNKLSSPPVPFSQCHLSPAPHTKVQGVSKQASHSSDFPQGETRAKKISLIKKLRLKEATVSGGSAPVGGGFTFPSKA
jgi:hypothetical protein